MAIQVLWSPGLLTCMTSRTHGCSGLTQVSSSCTHRMSFVMHVRRVIPVLSKIKLDGYIHSFLQTG